MNEEVKGEGGRVKGAEPASRIEAFPLHPSPFPLHRAAKRRVIMLAALAATLPGCGFHLRRSAALPFRTLYTTFATTSAIGAEFRRHVRVAEDTRLVDDPKEADARLEVLSELREKEVVGYSTTGRPREYQLRLRFTFRVVARDGTVLLAPTQILLRRDITSTDIEQVAKQQEEELLYKEMQSDLVQQLLRRLAAIDA